MTFKKIGDHRYQVLFAEDSPIVAKRLRAGNRSRKLEDPCFAGTVSKEIFVSYPAGKPIERSFWTARTPGYVPIPGQHSTHNDAAALLLKGVPA
jgi:hypothetical protein